MNVTVDYEHCAMAAQDEYLLELIGIVSQQ